MRDKDKQEIIRILQEIKSKSSLAVKGGSGGANRYKMRDPKIIWDLGMALNNALQNSNVSDEKRKGWIRKTSRKLDTEILGEGNEWCKTAYDWITRFQTKDHYLFVCGLAGYRDNEKINRFNKRRVEYLKAIYTKIDEPSISKLQISKLTKILEKDDVLELNDPEYLKQITIIRGKQKIDWSFIMNSIDDLTDLVESAMEEEEDKQNRKILRENIGVTLITQLRYALQLCVMDNKTDFETALTSEKVREIFKKKPKSNYELFIKLFENLKKLLKSFEEKKKKIKKKDYYDLEQLNSELDAIRNEDIYYEFMKRKKALGEIF